ncbi:hypothetical protein FACS189432_07070 [Bacteroidia bacterium]|nr:hypothetical protein FACS189426_15510 [Bacteroidia bacterium]GHT28717.1 hypothetical protein FACS189432_07070 [Bacteroidia bacterium]
MKTVLKIKQITSLLLIGAICFCTACSDDFLNRTPQDRPGPDNFLRDEASAKKLVIASYSPWVTQTQMYGKRFMIMCDGLTDDRRSAAYHKTAHIF